MDYVGLLPPNSKVYFVRYAPGCLELPPWGNEEYDCFVLQVLSMLSPEEIRRLATELALGRNDWVQVLGRNSEMIHDAVDHAAVDVGRQKAVGDGSPMTSWHTNVITLEAMVDFVLHGSYGAKDYLAAVLLCSDDEYSQALSLGKANIGARWQGFH